MSARAEADSPLILLAGVTKDYASGAGTVHALRELDLSIFAGEFVAVVGTSGSGKSTLMNILGCLDRPTRGNYSLADLEVGARSGDERAIVRNRLIGFIFQGFNLLSRTTAQENVELPLQYRGVPARARKKRAEEALDAVGLTGRGHHTPNQLSGGQQQRVAIARALVTDPPLLLADEPTGNLDTRTSLEVLSLLQRLNTERGITIVLVTHEHDIAACASRVVTFRDGRVVSDVRQDTPMNAAAELARLPPELQGGPGSTGPDEATQAANVVGPPIPARVYVAMLGAGVLGILLGVVYNFAVLQERVAWIPVLFAFLLESYVGARYGKRVFGRPLTGDQRARLSLFYTLVVMVLALPVLYFRMGVLAPKLAQRLANAAGPEIALFLLVVVGVAVAVSLFRFLTLSLISSLSSSRAQLTRAG